MAQISKGMTVLCVCVWTISLHIFKKEKQNKHNPQAPKFGSVLSVGGEPQQPLNAERAALGEIAPKSTTTARG